MATQHNVALIGMKSRKEAARLGKEVVGFISADRAYAVVRHEAAGGDIDTDTITLKTAKGQYVLTKSAVANRYEGTCNGIRVHVVLNKIVGKVIFWVKDK